MSDREVRDANNGILRVNSVPGRELYAPLSPDRSQSEAKRFLDLTASAHDQSSLTSWEA